MEQIKEIKQSSTEPVNFVIFFCVTLYVIGKFSFWKGDWELGYIMSSPSFEIFLILFNFLRSLAF